MASGSKAWVVAGTWRATVTRSYTGVGAGANGTYYLTPAAADAINAHERAHIRESRGAATQIVLNPFAFYGRSRRFQGLLPGRYTFYAYLLRAPATKLLPQHPVDQSLVAAAAQPLEIHVLENPIIINLNLSLP